VIGTALTHSNTKPEGPPAAVSERTQVPIRYYTSGQSAYSKGECATTKWGRDFAVRLGYEIIAVDPYGARRRHSHLRAGRKNELLSYIKSNLAFRC
jgi:hypothetical protein